MTPQTEKLKTPKIYETAHCCGRPVIPLCGLAFCSTPGLPGHTSRAGSIACGLRLALGNPRPFADLKLKREKLTLENSIAEQELKQTLASLAAEKQRLEMENSIAQAKLQRELAVTQAKIEKSNKQADLLSSTTS